MKKKILSLCIYNILLFTFVSCNFDWFGDLKTALEEETTIQFNFYMENDLNAPYFKKNIKYNEWISYSNFPNKDDANVKNWTSNADFKLGYDFTGWQPMDGYSEEVDGDGLSKVNVTFGEVYNYYATWSGSSNTPYTVLYVLQNINDEKTDVIEEYTEFKSETAYGVTGELTNFVPDKEFPGYEVSVFEQKLIKSDGSTKLYIKYNRKLITITYIIDGIKSTKQGYYGTVLPVPEVPDFETGYLKGKWKYPDGTESDYLPDYVPDSDITFTADKVEWKAKYKVVHKVQSLENPDVYEDYEEEELEGLVGNSTAATAKNITGFELHEPVVQDSIFPENTVIEIKYDRKNYSITFNFNKEIQLDGNPAQSSEKAYKYGEEILLTNLPEIQYDKSKFIFVGYTTVDGDSAKLITYPYKVTEDLELYGIWEDKPELPAITVSISNPSYETQISSDIIGLTAAFENGKIKLSANSTDITKYQWYVDGEIQASTTNTMNYSINNTIGTFDIMLVVTYKGKLYAATLSVTVEKGDL